MADVANGAATEQDIPQEIIQNAKLAVHRSAKRTREIFAADFGQLSALDKSSQPAVAPTDPSPADKAQQASVAARIRNEYADVKELPAALAQKQANAQAGLAARRKKPKTEEQASDPKMVKMIEGVTAGQSLASGSSSMALTRINGAAGGKAPPNANGPTPQRDTPATNLVRRDTVRHQKPQWHAPWKLMRVISGHLGWVRALAVEPGNQWFASGAGDRTIKIWDMASGTLKVTLTGHISTVRGLAVSDRHPYLFSCGEDKMVKCWDLETNKVIRHYHGHLSGVYTLSMHPTLDVLCTGGRDGVVRVWDMRTRSNVHVLSGHKGTVSSIQTQATDPQIISSSLDSTIRMYDLAAGKTMGVLTHHKKGVRDLTIHPTEYTFASASPGQIKQWLCPRGDFMQNFEGHNSVINSISVNQDNVLFSGGDNGSVGFCFAVIAGVGSGTGSSIARRFAKEYPIALLARNPESYEGLVQEINNSGGKAIGVSADTSDEQSLKSAFQTIAQKYDNAPCAAAIYNASGGFVRKPFLETKIEDLDKGWGVTVKGALFFSQATLPLLLKHTESQSATATAHPPTLIFTGATASIKANAQMATFAAPKWALRAMSMSLAKEFGPQGVHVAHAVIDGVIDIPKSQEMLKDLDVNARLGPEDIAKTYWDLHTQSRRGFTSEVDIRPMLEKW